MKKWFFSNNGKVTAPLDLEAAKKYLTTNPNVYGWHPSFNQWKPVNCISEFVGVVPETVQLPLIPKEISDKFLAKKKRLAVKFTSIDDSINHSKSSLSKLEQQIESYRELTKNLNDDVKDAIDNIDKKCKGLGRKLSQVKDAVHIAEKEMSDVVNEFDHKTNANDIFMPSCKTTGELNINDSSIEDININKAKLAQEKLATPHKRVDVKVEEKVIAKPSAIKEPIKPVKVAKKADINSDIMPPEERLDPEAEYANKMAKESFNGMKNMMKSVFKGDSKVNKVEESKNKEEPLSMAERLKMAQSNQ